MPFHRQRKITPTHCIPINVYESKVRFSEGFDLMKTVRPHEDYYRPSLTLSIVPEEDEEAISAISVVIPVIEGKTMKRRRMYGLVEHVIDLVLVMQRKVHKAKRQVFN